MTPPDALAPKWTALLRIYATYMWRHQRLPEIHKPQKFTEWVQHRKLYDRDPRMPIFADKLAVKEIAQRTLGNDWITPTYWSGNSLPERIEWPTPFVIKSRHGCNQNIFVHSDTVDWSAMRTHAQAWMNKTYGYWLDEWGYRDIAHGLLVEPYIGINETLPLDYKFYVFASRVKYIQVHLDRGGKHRWILFDPQWNRVSASTIDPDPAPPPSLAHMIKAAQKLGKGFDFIRADFYEPAGKPVFGEVTFYPGSGLDPFDQPGLDRAIGAEWSRAVSGAYAQPLPPPLSLPIPGKEIPALA